MSDVVTFQAMLFMSNETAEIAAWLNGFDEIAKIEYFLMDGGVRLVILVMYYKGKGGTNEKG